MQGYKRVHMQQRHDLQGVFLEISLAKDSLDWRRCRNGEDPGVEADQQDRRPGEKLLTFQKVALRSKGIDGCWRQGNR